MNQDATIVDIIKNRFSCRSYSDQLINGDNRRELLALMEGLGLGPLGSAMRFRLVEADDEDKQALRGLGTYGFIKGRCGFVIGAASPSEMHLEDYGHALERIVLLATRLGLGTCWLGGTFNRSGFARKIAAAGGEEVPSVLAIGVMADEQAARKGELRRAINADKRLPWERLFFSEAFDSPLSPEDAGEYGNVLEMVRLGPSASNKQPWRILRAGGAWHLYVQHTPGYSRGVIAKFTGMPDVQRIDMGIAMCHFELTAREQGLNGGWSRKDPGIAVPDPGTEYRVTWS